MATDVGTSLQRSIIDAMEMMSFAGRQGISLQQDKIDAVVAATRARENITQEEEKAFWAAAYSIAQAIKPVTIESIRSTLAPNGRGRSPALKAAWRYRWRTIVTLVALLIFQIYWLIGTTVVTDLKDIRIRMEDLVGRTNENNRAIATLELQKAGAEVDQKPAGSEARGLATPVPQNLLAATEPNRAVGAGKPSAPEVAGPSSLQNLEHAVLRKKIRSRNGGD